MNIQPFRSYLNEQQKKKIIFFLIYRLTKIIENQI